MTFRQLLWCLAFFALLLLIPRPTQAAPRLTFTVNSTADTDDGTCNAANCTLREALNAANTAGAPALIAFNIPGSGVKTIRPTTPLPAITTNQLEINGYTQPGASPNTLAVGDNAVLKIQISGNLCSNCDGLIVLAEQNIIRGLVVNRFSFGGIRLYGGQNVIEGNFVGTDPSGMHAQGMLYGVTSSCTACFNNLIGGTTPAARNVISGNSDGINIGDGVTAGGHTIQGNYIGTNASGTGAIPNTDGINLSSRNTVIGGNNANARNVISGNHVVGVSINSSGFLGGAATDNVVAANFIGTTANGRGNLGNGSYGIYLGGDVAYTTVGGDTNAQANRIAFNQGAGIYLSNSAGIKNTMHRNRIFSNTGLGIDLAPTGVNPNDAGDADTGPNDLQNFPIVKKATSATRQIKVQLNSTPNQQFVFEFFASPTCDPSNYGEGKKFLGVGMAMTDGSGNVTFNFLSPKPFAVGSKITATVTDSSSNTSEFSKCKTAQ